MSFILSTIKQVRFLVYDCAFGTVQIVVNRPGNTALTQAAADTLVLSRVTDETNGDYSPYLQGDVPLSKKFITTKGRRALDDITINMRDSLGYSGSVNSVATAEHFLNGTSTAGPQTPEYKTFFNVFFNEAEQYPTWIIYEDYITGNTDVCGGWIDPAYKPISEPTLINAGTAQQIFLGSRTIKIVNLKLVTWGDVLALIAESDTVAGTPYLGFMLAPPGCQGKRDSSDHIFGSGDGVWYQAVPHAHIHDGGDARVLRQVKAPIWPVAPWTQGAVNGVATFEWLLSSPIDLFAHGYAVGDRGVLDRSANTGVWPDPTIPATYEVRGATGDAAVVMVSAGAGFVNGGNYDTTVTTGSGDGTLSFLVYSVNAKSGWGPSGIVFISLGTLFAKIAAAQGLNTFTPSTDLKSALSWFAQKVDNTNKCFPIDPTPIALDNLYVNLNIIAQSHPSDGSFWDNPFGTAPTAPITDALTSLCNLLLSDYSFPFEPDGTSDLLLKAMGSNTATLPAWEITGVPAITGASQVEPSTGPRSVAIHNRGDDLKIQAPFGVIGDMADIEVPFRIKAIGATSGRKNSDNVVDNSVLLFDTKLKPEEQADKCLMVYWEDENGAQVANNDVWKSLCYLFWLDSTSPANSPVYPDTWSPFPNNDGSNGTWHNSLYVVNAVFKSGDTPDPDLQAQVRGDEYFNTRNYHAVAFGTLSIDLPIIQTFSYAGVSDLTTGSIQDVGPGMSGNWGYEGTPQDWRSIELTQLLIAGSTDVKWQGEPNSGAFPNLTDLATGKVGDGGGTSSSTGGGSLSGGVPNGTTRGHFQPDSIVTLTGVLPQITTLDVYYLCNDVTTTGVLAPASPSATQTLVITNKTGTSFRAGDFHIPNGATRSFIHDGTNTPSDDPTLPNGWNHLDR